MKLKDNFIIKHHDIDGVITMLKTIFQSLVNNEQMEMDIKLKECNTIMLLKENPDERSIHVIVKYNTNTSSNLILFSLSYLLYMCFIDISYTDMINMPDKNMIMFDANFKYDTQYTDDEIKAYPFKHMLSVLTKYKKKGESNARKCKANKSTSKDKSNNTNKANKPNNAKSSCTKADK